MKQILFLARKDDMLSDLALEYLQQTGASVFDVRTSQRGEKPEIPSKNFDLIITFRSYVILTGEQIRDIQGNAVNFHPGPPNHPGTGGLNYALFEDEREFGVTLHLINEEIDDGEIIEVRRFPIYQVDDVPSLLRRTHSHLLHMFIDFCESMVGLDWSLERLQHVNEEWSGERRTSALLNQYQFVDAGITKEDLKARFRAFHTEQFPLVVNLHDFTFKLDN